MACRIRLGGGFLPEGRGNFLKYLKREWKRKEGRGNKHLKKGAKLSQGVGVLKGVTGAHVRTVTMKDSKVIEERVNKTWMQLLFYQRDIMSHKKLF